jgi:hypothetical protein
MASPRFGDQHELSGSVQKHGRVKSKQVANAKVTAATTKPPALPNTPSLVSGCNQRARVHERVKAKYRGVNGATWGC